MKNLIAWIKSHIAIVACTAVIIISLPVAWYFSSTWNAQIRQKQEKAAGDKLTAVNSAKVTYTLPKLVATDPSVEVTGAPNQTLTDWFKTHREKILAEAQGIVLEAEKINKRDHVPLVEGLFPNATGQAAQVKALELAEKIVFNGKDTCVYPKLLKKINAGEPPLAPDVASSIADERAKLQEQIAGGTKRELDASEREKVEKALVEKRLSEYRDRAANISVYASMDAFPLSGNMGSFIPRQMPDKPPPLDECFFWQFDYWLMSDVVDAIGAANRDAGGQPTSVEHSVVKRIDRIESSDNWVYMFSGGGGRGGGGAEPSQSEPTKVDAGSPDALIDAKYDRSITGRWSGPGNGVYDIRNVSLSVVVSSERLPEFINAFARTNFMTVTDIDLSDVDVWADLELGYYYGSEHVVRAKMVVETVWLRSWTVPIMPYKVRGYLGLPTEEPKAEGAEGEKTEPGSKPAGEQNPSGRR